MPKNKILVSIIIPYYKRLNFLCQAINSVLKQEGVEQRRIEIIVSDEDQKRKDQEVIKSIANNISYFTNEFEEGPGGNRQTALKHARGEFVVFLDSDDQLEPNFTREMINAFKSSNFSAAVCFSRSYFEQGFSLLEKIKLLPLILIRDSSLLAGYYLNKGRIYPSAFYLCQLSHMMYKKSSLNNFQFNYDYRHGGEDWDLVVKTLKKGPIAVVPKRLLRFRYSSNSSTNSPLNRRLKWKSYSLLASRLPKKNKQGIFYRLFLYYIKLFKGKNEIQKPMA